MTDIWMVLLGGALTLAGTGLTELVRSREASKDRRERRGEMRREYNRDILDQLQTAASLYQKSLIAYGIAARELASGESVPAAIDETLRAARATFQALLYRVDPKVTAALTAWENAAVNLSQDEGGSALESSSWDNAMRVSGVAVRNNL